MKNTNVFPDWYWEKGLHDAKILRTESLVFHRDYKNVCPERTAFKLYLNTQKAIFENKIKSITLYDYQILSEFESFDDVYWLSDTLTEANGRYILEIILCSLLYNNEFAFKISFTHADIEK